MATIFAQNGNDIFHIRTDRAGFRACLPIFSTLSEGQPLEKVLRCLSGVFDDGEKDKGVGLQHAILLSESQISSTYRSAYTSYIDEAYGKPLRMDNRSGQVLGVAITFLILTWLTVGLRCYVRIFMVKGVGIDDYTMIVTLCFFTAYLVCQIGGAAHGTGIRRALLTDENAQIALRYWFFCEIFYTLSTCMLKIAVGFFLLRITIVRFHILIIRMIMVVSVVVGIAYTSVVIFQCRPISFWWDLDPDHSGTCLSSTTVMNFTFIVSALNSFADWTFAALPILIIKDLQMKKRMKIVASSVIAVAAIGSTATIIRLPYTKTLEGYKGDFLYRTTDFAIWSTVEVGLGITAGSIATLRPLVKSALEMSRSVSAIPWSRGATRPDQHGSGQQLSDLKPSIKRSITITTSRMRRESAGTDEENILGTNQPSEVWHQ